MIIVPDFICTVTIVISDDDSDSANESGDNDHKNAFKKLQ